MTLFFKRKIANFYYLYKIYLNKNQREHDYNLNSLSAHLWESTGNMTYLNAAEQSASFVYTHMYSPTDKVITDLYVSRCFQ